MLGAAGLVAVWLAAIGLYGVLVCAIAVGVVAHAVPALLAVRVAPSVALRSE